MTGTRAGAPSPGFQVVDTGVRQAASEEAVLAFWREHRIFQRSVDERPPDRHFVFYEGPPTTNGRPGVHHVLGRTIKDLVCRFRTMEGYRVRRKGGWDTHGLPVEIEVEKELGLSGKPQIEAYGLAEFNARCRTSVFKYLDEWKRITERIGFWIDLEDPYVTLDNDYIETVWHLLKRFWEKDLFYAGFKVVPYCPRCGTALSDHEVSQGYKEVTEPAVFVKFALADEPGAFVLAWTTTPWTLPGNVALAVGPDIDYARVRRTDPATGKPEVYYLAKERLEAVLGPASGRPGRASASGDGGPPPGPGEGGPHGAPGYEVLGTVKGRDLAGRAYRPLLDGLDLGALTGNPAYFVAEADFVTTEDGTGVVHTAVMYGADDYALGDALGLPKRHTVDETGRFTGEVPFFGGRRVKEVDPEIIEHLKRTGRLLAVHDYTHNYPFCWRCDTALLYYARDSWYLRTTAFRDTLVAENAKVRWVPPSVGENRFANWLEGNVDWAISRDRYWGTPLPLWRCTAEDCGHVVCIGSRAEIREHGGEVPDDLHRPAVDAVVLTCETCGKTMRRVRSVLDVWFDSGAMPFAQRHYPFENDALFRETFPADFISEGIDQSRGWFYSLLAISVMEKGVAPYRTVLSNELVLDAEGRKMSKRIGNTVDCWEILNAEGADALRWYLIANSPPWVPTRFVREGVTETARKLFTTLRNVAAFLATYANIDGWTPRPAAGAAIPAAPGSPYAGSFLGHAYAADAPPVAERPAVDRWLLSRLDATSAAVREALDDYQLTRGARALGAFVLDEVSNWYVRRNRRRFWKGDGGDKAAAYATLHETLVTVSRLLAPYAPFLAETLHRTLVVPFDPEAPPSVHLCDFPAPAPGRRDEALERAMELALQVVEAGRAARTQAGLKVRQPLPRLLVLGGGVLPGPLQDVVLDELNVKAVEHAAAEAAMTASLKPDFKALGPRFGGDVNKVAQALRALDDAAVRQGLARGAWTVTPEGMDPVEVAAGQAAVVESPREGFALAASGAVRVALDTAVDEALRTEGSIRELVHQIQNERKEQGLLVTDRITLFLGAGPALRAAVAAHADLVRSEVLAVALEMGEIPAGAATWDVDGAPVSVRIARA